MINFRHCFLHLKKLEIILFIEFPPSSAGVTSALREHPLSLHKERERKSGGDCGQFALSATSSLRRKSSRDRRARQRGERARAFLLNRSVYYPAKPRCVRTSRKRTSTLFNSVQATLACLVVFAQRSVKLNVFESHPPCSTNNLATLADRSESEQARLLTSLSSMRGPPYFLARVVLNAL